MNVLEEKKDLPALHQTALTSPCSVSQGILHRPSQRSGESAPNSCLRKKARTQRRLDPSYAELTTQYGSHLTKKVILVPNHVARTRAVVPKETRSLGRGRKRVPLVAAPRPIGRPCWRSHLIPESNRWTSKRTTSPHLFVPVESCLLLCIQGLQRCVKYAKTGSHEQLRQHFACEAAEVQLSRRKEGESQSVS